MERSDEQPKSQYISRRDIKVFLIGMGIVALVLSPVYLALRENSDAYICRRNIKGIGNALSLYAADNNDRLPPAYMAPDGSTPLIENGGVYSWAYLASQYMKKDVSFKCPKAKDDECYLDHDYETGALIQVSYGMYLPMSAMPLSSIPNPDSAILIGETVSLGKMDTYDPHPLTGEDGKPTPDGFIIAWDTGNIFDSDRKVTSVSRLAYPNTKDGNFSGKASRHPDGNHYLTVSSRALTLPPSAARVNWDAKRKRITGMWAIPE
jgi:hypothetical protein